MTRPCFGTLCLALTVVVVAAARQRTFAVGITFRWPAVEETIDWAAQDADVIVRGSATSVQLWTASDGRPVARVNLRVSEALKGSPGEACVFLADLDGLGQGAAWLKKGAEGEALFFLVRSEGYDRRSRTAAGGTLVVNTSGGEDPLVSCYGPWVVPLEAKSSEERLHPIDLFGVRHDTAESILAASREALRADVVGREPVKIWVRHPDDQGTFLALIAPINSRLESAAHGWLRERDQVQTALGVLEHFPSKENAALVMPFLNDESFSRSLSHKWGVRTYEIRKLAYDVLRAYGRNVSRPVTEELTEYVPAHRSPLAWGAGVFLLLLLAPPLVRRRPLAAGAALGFWALVLVLAGMLVRERTVHEVVMSVGDSACEVGSYPDGIHLKRIQGWPVRAPLSYGQCQTGMLITGGWDPPEESKPMQYHPLGIVTRTGYAAHGYFVSGAVNYRFDWILLPHWLVATSFAVLPGAWVLSLLTSGPRRRAARMAKGLCGECGYNVRASEGRCPECGKRMPRAPGGPTPGGALPS